MEIQHLINATLLLLLSFLGNYTGGLIGCKLEKIVSTSHPLLKMFYVVLMVYSCFTITDNKTNHHPLKLLLYAFLIVFVFNMFNRQTHYTLVIALFLMISILFVNKLITYSEKNKDYTEKTIKNLKKFQDFLMVSLATILTLGFIIYFIEKKNEYGKKFDLITFLVGNEKCKNN